MATVGSSIIGSAGATPIDLRVATPTIANIAMATATTEYSYALPATSKRFTVLNRANGKIQLSYSVGTSGTTYVTLFPGVSYMEDNIHPSTSLTLYFQSPSASQTLEIVSWI